MRRPRSVFRSRRRDGFYPPRELISITFPCQPQRSTTASTGRAYGRNRRGLRAQGPKPLEAVEPPVLQLETTAEAIAALDAQFSWLRGAGDRTFRRRWRSLLDSSTRGLGRHR